MYVHNSRTSYVGAPTPGLALGVRAAGGGEGPWGRRRCKRNSRVYDYYPGRRAVTTTILLPTIRRP